MNNENIKTNVWKAGLAVGVLLAVFLLIVSIKELKAIGYVGKDTPITNTISVSGKGEAFSTPDIATFSFSVTETAKTVTEAQTLATNKINAAIKALKDAKIADKDIKTSSYNINPHYDYQNYACTSGYCPPSKSVLTGYDVSQTIDVKVRDLTKAGAIFATIGAFDVQNVNGLQFSVDNIDEVKAQARALAIKDAQDKANLLASQLGVHIEGIVSFNDESVSPIYYARDTMSLQASNGKAAMAPAPEIPAGEQKITSNVSITYQIR